MSRAVKKLELLAPAGDLKRLKYAFAYGADAVYLGLPEFSLRARTEFDLKDLKAGIDIAHKLGKKTYVTVNIFAHEENIKELPKFLKQIKELKFDAIILSDAGILELVKKHLPKTPIHLSTQANVLNSEAVKFYYKNGVNRIILGREASLADIKLIKYSVPKMELEVFVHGAMCMSYSGRCYLSAWLNDRSANLGSCTQPCRFNYNVYLEEAQRPGIMIPLSEDEKGFYVLNSKDLCLIEYLPELISAGVDSIKIEGRIKSHYYVSMATKAYRDGIDAVYGGKNVKEKLRELKRDFHKIDNRGYTTGFLLGSEGLDRQEFETSKAQSDWQLVGETIGVKDGKVMFRVHNSWRVNEAVELVTPDDILKIKVKEFIDEAGNKLEEVHGGTDKIYGFSLPKNYKGSFDWGLIRKKIK